MKNSKPQFARLPWFPRDFASATRLWPLLARAVYRELLDLQWDVGGIAPGILPDDENQLRELVRASPTEWRVAWPYVEPKFPRLSGGGRQNARLEGHRKASVDEYRARQRGAAKTNARLGRNGSQSDALTDTPSDSLSVADIGH